jgi:uncharacterized membrane protein
METKDVKKEELTIEDLHKDLDQKLQKQGFIFDKRKFIFHEKNQNISDKIADRIAQFGGSWWFLFFYGIFLAFYVGYNIYLLKEQAFDPYPFVFLNLVLGILASVQAPIIMMTQNRQAQIDKKQEELNLEEDIVDFDQDRLDLIIDQKQWSLTKQMNDRLKIIEEKIDRLSKRR